LPPASICRNTECESVLLLTFGAQYGPSFIHLLGAPYVSETFKGTLVLKSLCPGRWLEFKISPSWAVVGIKNPESLRVNSVLQMVACPRGKTLACRLYRVSICSLERGLFGAVCGSEVTSNDTDDNKGIIYRQTLIPKEIINRV